MRASPIQPGHERSAPAHANAAVAAICQATWCSGSSAVSHPAKKTEMERPPSRAIGRWALSANPAPTADTARYAEGTRSG